MTENNYINWLSEEEFKKCLQLVCDSQSKRGTNKTRTSIQLAKYLDYLNGKYDREMLIENGFWDEDELITLHTHPFIIDIYMRMVNDLTKEML